MIHITKIWKCRCGTSNTNPYRCMNCKKKNPKIQDILLNLPCEVCGKRGHREEHHIKQA